MVWSLYDRAREVVAEKEHLWKEEDHLKKVFIENGYPQASNNLSSAGTAR